VNTGEIFTRLRLGLALLAGFGLGKYLATQTGHHVPEFFIAGFGTGVVLTQGLFWLGERWLRPKHSG
jgi:hypothetical protein